MDKDTVTDTIKNFKITTCAIAIILAMGGGGYAIGRLHESTNEENIGNESEVPDFESHQHVIIGMGENPIIIRECDDEIGNTTVMYGHGHASLVVRDEENTKILDDEIFGNIIVENIDTELEESEVLNLEDDLIEKGAILYKRY